MRDTSASGVFTCPNCHQGLRFVKSMRLGMTLSAIGGLIGLLTGPRTISALLWRYAMAAGALILIYPLIAPPTIQVEMPDEFHKKL
jgi:hypothetical protein